MQGMMARYMAGLSLADWGGPWSGVGAVERVTKRDRATRKGGSSVVDAGSSRA